MAAQPVSRSAVPHCSEHLPQLERPHGSKLEQIKQGGTAPPIGPGPTENTDTLLTDGGAHSVLLCVPSVARAGPQNQANISNRRAAGILHNSKEPRLLLTCH